MLKDLKKARLSAERVDAQKAERGVKKILKSYAELANQLKEEQERMQKEADNTEEDEDEEMNEDDESDTADDETASDE